MKKKTLCISMLSALCILGGSIGVFAKESPVGHTRNGAPCATVSTQLRAWRSNLTQASKEQGIENTAETSIGDEETTTLYEEEAPSTTLNPCPNNHAFCDGFHDASGNPMGEGTPCVKGHENCELHTGGNAVDEAHMHANQSGMHQGNGNGHKMGNRDGSGSCIQNQ